MLDKVLQSHSLETFAVNSPNSLLKLVVFEIGKLTLALPVEQVKKVVRYLPLHGSGTSYTNISHVGDRDRTIIDLHKKIFKVSQDEISDNKGYFILIENNLKEILGIRVIIPPSIIDMPISSIRTLPDSYRHSDTLEIASHVAIHNFGKGNSKTIFLLDLDYLI